MAYDLGTAHGTIELEYKGRAEVDKAQHDMDKLGKSGKKTEQDLTKLKGAFTSLGKGLAQFGKFSAIGVGLLEAGAAAGNLVVQLLGVVPALTSILSLSAALPGLFAGLAASVGVLKASFAGVGDAVKEAFSGSTDAAKFNEALKKLSPAAQTFAKAVKAAYPALHQLQQGIQETFFSTSRLAGNVPRASKALASLKPQLTALTAVFGETTREVVNFGLSADSITFVRKAVDSFTNALALVTPSLVPILAGLRAVGTVGLPLITRLGGAVSGLATQFADWLNAVASDGRLQTWINTALSTLKTLGTIAENVGGILESVFSAAAATGGGLLNTLAGITGAFNTFLQSAAGKSAITGLFTALAKVAGALTPVITTLVGALAGALAPVLQDLATTLGPVLLQVVQALAPAFGPLAQAIGDLLGAVAPVLPALASLVALVAGNLGNAISALSAELGPLISVLSAGLTGAIQAVLPGLSAFAQALPRAAELGANLAAAFAPLVPLFVQFGSVLGGAIQENMPQLLAATEQLVPAFTALAQALATSLAGGLAKIIPLIPTLVSGLVGVATVMANVITAIVNVLTFLTNLGTGIANVITSIVSFGASIKTGFVDGLTGAYNAVVGAGGTIVAFFAGLPGRIGSALAALPGVLVNAVKTMALQGAFQFGAAIGTLVSLAVTLPGRIAGAIAGLAGSVVGVVRAAWSAASSATAAGVSAAVAFARALPGRARGAIAALPGQLRAVAVAAWAAVRAAFSSGVSSVVGAARALPGRVRSAVGNLGSLLVGAGRDVVLGLARGISGAVGAAVSAASAVGHQVINGIKSTLKISSPSRVMITLGRYITQGLANGLTGTLSQLKTATNKVANAVRDAFSDKLIKSSQKNSVLNTLAKGNKQLTALVNKSNSVAGRLKTAQAFLKDVQTNYTKSFEDARQKVLDSFNLVTDGQSFVNLDLTKERLKAALAQAKQFATDIQTLAKRGLNKDLLGQLTSAGAEAGGAMAHALAAASATDLKDFNTLQTQLSASADQVGKTTQTALYGAGVAAAAGIVKGLQSQQKAIDKQMDSIANSMVKAIKKALKIKSPSREMFALGQFISQGLADGIASLRNTVVGAAASLATSAILPTVQLGASKAVAANAAATAGFTSGAATGNTVNFAQTVNALPGMSAKQVGDYALTKLSLALKTGVGAVNLASPTPSLAGA